MLAIEARKMGYRVSIFSPDSNTPAGQVADTEITSAYEDTDRVEEFARSVDIVTLEFENIPSKTIETASSFVQVHPSSEVLHITQNRLREKNFLSKNNFPVTPFKKVKTIEDLYRAVQELGMPCVLKTAGFGYDGKGQSKIKSASDIERVFDEISEVDCVLEAFVDFEKEVSIVCARDIKGNFTHYGIIENDHVNHILDISQSPGGVSDIIRNDAIEIARGIAEKFEFVGTLCVEFFLTKCEKLLVNEIAPRPHNSGHLTFESSCITSQFEQQLRSVCGLPLGSTEFLKPVAMANILGDLWQTGEPDWIELLKKETVKLHLYGKNDARSGRKMGHLVAMGNNANEAAKIVREARALLKKRS